MDIRVLDGFRNITLIPTKQVTGDDDIFDVITKLVGLASPEARHLGRVKIEIDREARHSMDVWCLQNGDKLVHTTDVLDSFLGFPIVVTGDA